MSHYPILGDSALDKILICHKGQAINRSEFLAQVLALSKQLPDHRYVINLCEDRYHFMVGFMAGLIKGQVNILPPNRVGVTIARLKQSYSDIYALVDVPGSVSGLEQFQIADLKITGNESEIPTISANQDAVIIFTSGSTGTPVAHVKSWQSLVKGAQTLAKQFFSDATDTLIVGTIPAQHMFGLETTIMLPLQSGVAVHSGRPFFPQDLREVLQETNMRKWLMTTPLHLRTFVSEEISLPMLNGTISATMPLPVNLAKSAEKLSGKAVYEIYGCTETGIIAFRHTTENQEWQTFFGIRLFQEHHRNWVVGAHISEKTELPDQIEIKSDSEFILMGRSESMIKIAGKRASLEGLNFEINQIPGVCDSVFWLPEGEERLVAFAVVADTNKEKIIAELRNRIDPVFMPRPLYIVETLPRNENGKITKESIADLLIRIRNNSGHTNFEFEGEIATNHPSLAGHFPGYPVVPGVVLLNFVIHEIQNRLNGIAKINGLPNIKFLAVLQPGERFCVKYSIDQKSCRFDVVANEISIAKGSFSYESKL